MTQLEPDFRIGESDLPPIVIDDSELEPLPTTHSILTFIKSILSTTRNAHATRDIDEAQLIGRVEEIVSLNDITISENQAPFTVEELFPEHPIPTDQGAIDINFDVDEGLALRLGITAQNNRNSAKWFFGRLRQVAQELPIMIQNNVKDSGQYFGGSDLVELANRWNMPIIVKQQGRHWFLMLSTPQKVDGAWKFLAYNPYYEEETWMDLPGYDTAQQDITSYLHAQSIFANEDGLNSLRDGTYNLALPVDEEMAKHAEIARAKRVDLQPRIDAQNCGPACLLMAAIRTGLHPENSLFIDVGKELMETDLSTKDEPFHILTRDEILEQLNGPAEQGQITIN